MKLKNSLDKLSLNQGPTNFYLQYFKKLLNQIFYNFERFNEFIFALRISIMMSLNS